VATRLSRTVNLKTQAGDENVKNNFTRKQGKISNL
jgi:hypothetical protein